MIEIKITEQMKQRAWRKARQMGKLKQSITKGDGISLDFWEKK